MQYHWDEEPEEEHGLAGGQRFRRWHRGWHQYLTVLLLVGGVFMVIGSVSAPGRATLGGVLVVAAGLALTVADGPRQRPGQPPPPRPTRLHEVLWTVAAVALVVIGVALFAG